MGKAGQSAAIRQFILESLPDRGIGEAPKGLLRLVADRFAITPQAAHHHLRALEDEGIIRTSGRTRQKRYELVDLVHEGRRFDRVDGLSEDRVWDEFVKPAVRDHCKANVYAILAYGFSEMFNNAIDHSDGRRIDVNVRVNRACISIVVTDDGVGIFQKIQHHLGLAHPRESILELAKGKFTTDPQRHSGQGIFFASRMFDQFIISSANIGYVRHRVDDYLIEEQPPQSTGTLIHMRISVFSTTEIADIFGRFQDDDHGFTRTQVPVEMATMQNDPLVSRSQARRIVSRFERFKHVILDFKGVAAIGQAFADEIFRVFRRQTPQVRIEHINAAPDVKRMIRSAEAEAQRGSEQEARSDPRPQ